MSIEFIVRIIGMIVFTIAGVYLGSILGPLVKVGSGSDTLSIELFYVSFGMLGALVGLTLTPIITIRPILALRSLFSRIAAHNLFAALVGVTVGLIIAALFAFPVSLLPSPFGDILPFIGVLLFGYLGVSVFVMRQHDLFAVLSAVANRTTSRASKEEQEGIANGRNILLDTSVIIDGRIADIARTGFLPGSLLIPRFVLTELQYIADSPDSLRRQRGRRGMEIISQLQKEHTIPVQLSDIDVEGVREVDDKLVILARQMRCPILTNDYNLNRIAELQGVSILNVNELANAVKSVLMPGELLTLRVIQEGKEAGQGVGYMDDGTMVVIENGRDHINLEIDVMVTKVLQTAAGRMIFARPEEHKKGH